MPLIGVADSLIVVNRLVQIGFNESRPNPSTAFYGGANPLINFPAVLTIAMAMSLVPPYPNPMPIRITGALCRKPK